MRYSMAVATMLVASLIASESQAQFGFRNQSKSQTIKRVNHDVTRVSCESCNDGASNGEYGYTADVCNSCGGSGDCGCSPGTCQAVPYPRCFKFNSPCGGGAMGCDLCCGTIFSEMYCSLQGGMARLRGCGTGLFGRLLNHDCGCTDGCSCITSEPACGIVTGSCMEPACGIASVGCGSGCVVDCEPGCGIADVGCGIADVGCAAPCEPGCGIADVGCAGGCLGGCAGGCEPGCGIVEPTCGIAGSSGCFQDLITPSCGGGCHFGIAKPGFLASLGNLLFGGCSCGCSSCCGYDGCSAGEVYYEDGGDVEGGCPGGGCAANSRRTLKYTIAQKPGSDEPVYVGQRAEPGRVEIGEEPAQIATQPGVRRTSHRETVGRRANPTKSQGSTEPSRRSGSVRGPSLAPPNQIRTSSRESQSHVQQVSFEAPADKRITISFDED